MIYIGLSQYQTRRFLSGRTLQLGGPTKITGQDRQETTGTSTEE